jgi:hypothetical protein
VLKRLARSVLVLIAVTGLVAACGGDDDDSSDATTTTTAPEDARASDADVAAGLQTIKGIAGDISAAVAGGKDDEAKELVEKIEPTWEEIEGTIKENDEEAYLTFEDAFAAIGLAVEDGDDAGATKAASDISAAAAAYLEAHPA